jgi:hypothetical protein
VARPAGAQKARSSVAFNGVFVHPGFGRAFFHTGFVHGESRAASWLASFENHIFPTLGKRETATLKPAELVAVILPVWTENHDTGTRLCQRIQAVFDQAIKIDDDGRFKDKVNVAGGLFNRLPTGLRPPVRHMRCSGRRCHHSTPPSVRTVGMPAKALRILIVCGAPRAAEVFKMRWIEIGGNLWQVAGTG